MTALSTATQDATALQKRRLTNLYNLRQNDQVQWLQHAHQHLDAAVATAYGWADYTLNMPDEDILKRLLAINLARSGAYLVSAQLQSTA